MEGGAIQKIFLCKLREVAEVNLLCFLVSIFLLVLKGDYGSELRGLVIFA